MAAIGIDIERMLEDAVPMERLCASDSPDNPAVWLAAFLYDNLKAGRNKFSLLMPPSKQVFGLWVEQLVAESLGKAGVGILPNVEVDAGILSDPHPDRCAILCNMDSDEAFEHARTCVHPDIPVFRLDIPDSTAMTRYFLIWEYAVAFCGWLMQINPSTNLMSRVPKSRRARFSTTKAVGVDVPEDVWGKPAYEEFELDLVRLCRLRLRELGPARDAGRHARGHRCECRAALAVLLIKDDDYFSLNAFLPFKGVGRRETLEKIRHRAADRLDVCSCLEIGPRYLHSTGQLHKGGPNTGVFLVVSADEPFDITVPHEDFTLGDVANAEALGDFSALASRGRRAIYIHLKDNDDRYLSSFANDDPRPSLLPTR